MNASDPAAWLFPRTAGGIRWGLERTEALLAGAGDPHRRFRALHVGGTNGKGSVAGVLAAVLEKDGFRTGLFTSPPLVSWRECVRIAGRAVSEAELVESAALLAPGVERVGASFFEAFTALAFLVFARAEVDFAVVEVGMGGADDATNVLVPEVAFLTNVGLDHVHELGRTRREIARVKSGIFKAGVPAVTTEHRGDVLGELRARARSSATELHVVSSDEIEHVRWTLAGTRFRLQTSTWGILALETPLVGPVQALNVALAVRGLELLPEPLRPAVSTVCDAVGEVRIPGRFQVAAGGDATWIFDVAHNASGVRALVKTLRGMRVDRPLVVVAGILADKDWPSMLRGLLSVSDRLVLTVPSSAPLARRWEPHAATSLIGDARMEVRNELTAALARARELAGSGTVLVVGSHFTVGDAVGAVPP